MQMRYDRISYISLLTLFIYKSASRIQSTYRGHVARRVLAPRFLASWIKPIATPHAAIPPPAAPLQSAANDESSQHLLKTCASRPPSPLPPAKDGVDDQPAASMFPVQILAPRGKDKMCPPVWLLQVLTVMMVIIMEMVMNVALAVNQVAATVTKSVDVNRKTLDCAFNSCTPPAAHRATSSCSVCPPAPGNPAQPLKRCLISVTDDAAFPQVHSRERDEFNALFSQVAFVKGFRCLWAGLGGLHFPVACDLIRHAAAFCSLCATATGCVLLPSGSARLRSGGWGNEIQFYLLCA